MVSRFAVELSKMPQENHFVLGFIRRILKLFPFEQMEIEVQRGRSRDLFEDWDSYLEWFRADEPHEGRWFSSITVMRKHRFLGYLVWEQREKATTSLAIYTEGNQSGPLEELSRAVGEAALPPREVVIEKGGSQSLSPKKRFFFRN
ncbi:MAG: hypothetical protein EBZ49_13840 [Proteobacteria bacterium]|nr:hypothetical protein [Pseudomonadota bacterium]